MRHRLLRHAIATVACSVLLGVNLPTSAAASTPRVADVSPETSEYYEAGFGGLGVAVAGGALGVLLLVSGTVELRKNGLWKTTPRVMTTTAVVTGPINPPPTRPTPSNTATMPVKLPGDVIPEPAESVVRHEISHMIRTIDEVALRANVLALDAAVEAAGSGGSAMGFALVADEVRTLAQGTARAARETADTYEECLRRRDSAVQIYTTVGQRLCVMVQQARQVHEFVDRIANIAPESKSLGGAAAEMERGRLKSQAAALHRCVQDLQALV